MKTSPTLWYSNTSDPVPVSNYCASDDRDGVLCFTPEDAATIDEAYSISEMVAAESWDSLTVVTDEYHAFRTRFIFDQCLGDEVDVNVVFSDRDLSVGQWAITSCTRRQRFGGLFGRQPYAETQREKTSGHVPNSSSNA